MRPLWMINMIILYITLVQSKNYFQFDDRWREKRQVNSIPLIYPYGATYKLVLGFSVPVHLKEKISLAFAGNFQYQYLQFQNISQLSQYYFIKTVSREEREATLRMKRNERLTFYKAMESLLQTKGLDGRECMLQAICESAQYPVEEEGLIGEIMHILLTPDYGHKPLEDPGPEWVEAISQYKDAATVGRQMFDCPSVYDGCSQGRGLMDLVTVLRED